MANLEYCRKILLVAFKKFRNNHEYEVINLQLKKID